MPDSIISSNSLTNFQTPKKHLWFIHGANASSDSFNFIKYKLKESSRGEDFLFKNISYDCQDNIEDVVSLIAEAAKSVKGDLFIIGHSLGGVISIAVAQQLKLREESDHVRGVFTMSAPFGGVESADYLRWIYPQFNLFKNISTHNSLIKEVNKLGAVVPTVCLVSTSGNNPLFPNANDGVVTTKSQRALMNAAYIEFPSNHFEILLSEKTVGYLTQFIEDISI